MPHRILVVDDEPDISRSLQDLLGLVPDCQVEVASSFAEGRAKALEGTWDIIISDERLPDGRGVEILAEVARSHPGTTRVLMSAFHDFDMLLRGVNAAHIDHFVQKPYEPSAVLEWVRRRVDSRGNGSPALARAARAGPFRRIG